MKWKITGLQLKTKFNTIGNSVLLKFSYQETATESRDSIEKPVHDTYSERVPNRQLLRSEDLFF